MILRTVTSTPAQSKNPDSSPHNVAAVNTGLLSGHPSVLHHRLFAANGRAFGIRFDGKNAITLTGLAARCALSDSWLRALVACFPAHRASGVRCRPELKLVSVSASSSESPGSLSPPQDWASGTFDHSFGALPDAEILECRWALCERSLRCSVCALIISPHHSCRGPF